MAENNLTTLAIGNALARSAEGITKESFPLHVFPQKMQKLILHLVKHRNFKLEFVASCMICLWNNSGSIQDAAAACCHDRRMAKRHH